MPSPSLHQLSDFPARAAAERGVGLQHAHLGRTGQVAGLAVEQPGDFELHAGGDEGVEVGGGVFEGEGVGVGQVGDELEVELGGE